MVSVTSGGQNLNIPTMVVPGTADFVLILPMGYGREFEGTVCSAAGFNVYPLRTLAAPYISAGATVKATGEQYELVSTQDYGSMVEPYTGIERPIVREASLEDYRAKPGFVQDKEILPVLQTGPYATTEEQLKSLWTPPNHTEGQQWAMTIDLNLCNGCNACAIACQAENNIPVVGKERVADGREMSWLRMDRYFTGTEDEPEAVVQPMACAHCEMAPCENVCPVAATTHSPDGLNDMAYNRCIGTRYCSNNCPFKVRRFNFFNYNKENEAAFPLHGMQKNPNVTVRFRGVMEKCTYCVQRIQEAKIAAKRDTVDGFIPDGTIETACSQICATKAIVFGDKNDPQSKVAQSRLNPRNYGVLAELNLHARTTYLAKIRNLNPALVDNGSTN
jgi:molybdopterin-containing oxidoreductase family iron-sulfur binding subunit